MMKTKGIGPTQSLRPNSASDRKDKEEKTLSLEKLLSDRGLVREKMLGLERKLQSSDRRLLCNPEEERSPTTMKEEEKRWEKEEETLLRFNGSAKPKMAASNLHEFINHCSNESLTQRSSCTSH
ncbi:uncharacterized protein LOC106753384 isoform X3 [Vigna radiata var. radiata]|uniref:Uncharacterized protein LOC106753384 isoform X3 n=1 Tax=Vigna radiata var. radiata TaxID=3916 RepID=A0A3Q0EQA6_VIGRR|nr:uncharacterized protein LOC106753384 isoform X3 [Vigna radiata var. radiata]